MSPQNSLDFPIQIAIFLSKTACNFYCVEWSTAYRWLNIEMGISLFWKENHIPLLWVCVVCVYSSNIHWPVTGQSRVRLAPIWVLILPPTTTFRLALCRSDMFFQEAIIAGCSVQIKEKCHITNQTWLVWVCTDFVCERWWLTSQKHLRCFRIGSYFIICCAPVDSDVFGARARDVQVSSTIPQKPREERRDTKSAAEFGSGDWITVCDFHILTCHIKGLDHWHVVRST